MQTLRFESPIIGISPCKDNFVVGTENDGIFVASSNTYDIKLQIPLPSQLVPTGPPVFSKDGDFIWLQTGKSIQCIKPVQNAQFKQIDFDYQIKNVYPHSDRVSVVAVLENKEIRIVRADENANPISFGPLSENESIISVLFYHRKAYIVIDAPKPYIQVLDAQTFAKSGEIMLPNRSSNIYTAVSSEFGVVIIWSDGYWTRYTEGESDAISDGKVIAAQEYKLMQSHLACSCQDSVHIYDLKFDAELQKIENPSQHICLFSNKIVITQDRVVHIRDWRGVKPTTSLSLIGSCSKQKPREELVLQIQYDDDMKHPTTAPVSQETAVFNIKSLRHAVESVMEDKFVSSDARQTALELAEKEEETDLRELAKFQLLTTIPYSSVVRAIENKSFDTASMMLKKVEPLNSEQVVHLIRLLMSTLKENEVVLTHLITQPHNDSVLQGAITSLTAQEADSLLQFLSVIIRSRRQWKDFEASLTALDSATRWSRIIISSHLTGLALENYTTGLKMVQSELRNEQDRIHSAGNCWAILKNITGDKKSDAPPSFMYIVEKLQIPE